MELSAGYAPGKNERAPLIGQNETTFPVQYDEDDIVRAFNHWKNDSPLQLLGISAFCVPETTSGKDKEWLQIFPNVGPDNENTTVFVAPQSEKPKSGNTQGLRSTINCTTVSFIKQFKLLSQRLADGSEPRCPAIRVGVNSYGYPYYAALPQGPCPYDVYVQKPSANLSGPMGQELWFWVDAFLELAVEYQRRDNGSFNGAGAVPLEAAPWQAPIKLYAGTSDCPVEEFMCQVQPSTMIYLVWIQMTTQSLCHLLASAVKPPSLQVVQRSTALLEPSTPTHLANLHHFHPQH